MNKYFGKRVYEGIAIGKLYKYDNNITVTKEIGQGYDVEINRFNEARQKAIDEYKFVHYNANKLMDKKNSDIIISLIMLLEDLDFIEGVENQLKNEKITAEYAVYLTMKQLQKLLSDLDNDYLKERIKDINDISFKVIYYLKGEQQQLNIDQPLIILADNMNASELIKIEKEKILGIVFQNVSVNSHIAILARSLAIPTIASIEEEIIYNDGDIVIVDGNHGILITSPTPKYLEEYSYLQSEYNKNKLSLDKYKNKKPYTKDGKTIEVFSNIASTYEIDLVLENNSDGIGLFRSEYIYMDSNTFPSEQSQFNHYKKVIQEMNDKITIIRTMDLGVDKTPSYIKMPKEINPALGSLMRNMAVKLFFNSVSTGTMARLGRVTGNWMSFVDCTNKKLLDRGTRLLVEIAKVDYRTACATLFEAMEEIAAAGCTNGEEKASPVQVALKKLRK